MAATVILFSLLWCLAVHRLIHCLAGRGPTLPGPVMASRGTIPFSIFPLAPGGNLRTWFRTIREEPSSCHPSASSPMKVQDG